MFGYIRPLKSEMLVKEYDAYKAVYCQLCRIMGDSLGIGTRFTLSYDAAFYSLVALGVHDSKVTLNEKKCTCNPLKKCKFLSSNGEEYEKAAALSVVMTYHKLLDNINDDNFFKSLGSRFFLPYIKKKYKRAKNKYPFIADIVQRAMDEQKTAESAEEISLDACCQPTANMLSELFQELAGEDNSLGVALKEFGYFLGRWVYLMDAADDLIDDIKSKSFNPLISTLDLHRFVGNKESISEDERKKADAYCNEALNANLAMMIPAINLIDFSGFSSIIENIILKGLPQIQKEILFLHVHDKKRKKEKI